MLTPSFLSLSSAPWRNSIETSSFSSSHCMTNGSNHLKIKAILKSKVGRFHKDPKRCHTTQKSGTSCFYICSNCYRFQQPWEHFCHQNAAAIKRLFRLQFHNTLTGVPWWCKISSSQFSTVKHGRYMPSINTGSLGTFIFLFVHEILIYNLVLIKINCVLLCFLLLKKKLK